jgi:hypothetical protein
MIARWRNWDYLEDRGSCWVLNTEVHATLSLGASAVTGSSKDGWKFWKYRFRTIEKAWHVPEDCDDALVFYDDSSPFPTNPVGVGEPFGKAQELLRRPNTQTSIAVCRETAVESLQFRTGDRYECSQSHEATLICLAGGLDVIFPRQQRKLSGHEGIVLPGGSKCVIAATSNASALLIQRRV